VALAQLAAVQRDWRGIRMAACSRERDDAPLPKIWTPLVVARSRKPWRLSMNQHAVVSKFSHFKPGEFKEGRLRDFFLYRDLGISDATPFVDKVPLPTPWE
jgi:hypothetical protein